MWRLGIFTFKHAERLGKDLKLISSGKDRRRKELLTLNRKSIYKGLDIYIQKMREIEKAKGYVSTIDLASATNRSIRHARRIINTARGLEIIKLVEPACKGHKNINYAKYEVIE